MSGYKLVHESGFLAEVAIGLGRNFGYPFSEDIGRDLFARLIVGYRF